MKELSAAAAAQSLRAQIVGEVHRAGYSTEGSIPEDMSFRQWCEDLGRRGMKVDNRAFKLSDRPALVPIYDAIPSTRAEAAGLWLIIQKATQLGLTVWEVLADVYMALKWSPVNIGLFLPDIAIARFKSQRRFMNIIRSVPELHHRLTHRIDNGREKRVGEGDVLTRSIGESLLMFLWTSGATSTEGRPMDIVSLDEVQEMLLVDIEKVLARAGDSEINFKLMLSTANWPELDINAWYLRGTQEVWHTRCEACGELSDLSDPAAVFPSKSIAYNTGDIAPAPIGHNGGPPLDPPHNEYVWVCPHCRTHIPDPQHGEYVASNAKADPTMRSFLLPRTISPRQTPRLMIEGWTRATTGDLKKNFYNRTLARTYIDPDQTPVTLARCRACVEDGRAAGIVWETAGSGYLMGIDQMGSFNVAVIKKRLQDGRQATVHVEAIMSTDPFARCDELMKAFGISVCVVEQLPNVNDARKFANRHRGRVFLAGYAELRDDMMIWGDDLSKSDKRTSQEDRSRYTVTINQYKAMELALHRVRDRHCLFPDPALLEQEYEFRGRVSDGEEDSIGATRRRTPILEVMFEHLTKTALVVETDEKTLKKRPKVMKLGIDPHFAFANMLCDIAWARYNGVSMIMLPPPESPGQVAQSDQARKIEEAMPGLPKEIIRAIDDLPAGTCGRCSSFQDGRCTAREVRVREKDPGCVLFTARRS